MTQYKRLGASNPVASTNTQLFQVGLGKYVVVSTLNICNFGTSVAKVRIAHVDDGSVAEMADEDWVIYDLIIAPKDFLPATIGMTLDQGDSLIVYADSSDVSFIAWGAEE